MVLPIFYKENALSIGIVFYAIDLEIHCKTIDDGHSFTIFLNDETMHHNFAIERANTSAHFLFHLSKIHPSNSITII